MQRIVVEKVTEGFHEASVPLHVEGGEVRNPSNELSSEDAEVLFGLCVDFALGVAVAAALDTLVDEEVQALDFEVRLGELGVTNPEEGKRELV